MGATIQASTEEDGKNKEERASPDKESSSAFALLIVGIVAVIDADRGKQVGSITHARQSNYLDLK